MFSRTSLDDIRLSESTLKQHTKSPAQQKETNIWYWMIKNPITNKISRVFQGDCSPWPEN